MPYEWCYDYEYIANYLSVTTKEVYKRCALISRGAVHKDFRGNGIYIKMVETVEHLMRSSNADIMLGTWIFENSKAALIHEERHGWIFPKKNYINSKGKPYYFGFKILG